MPREVAQAALWRAVAAILWQARATRREPHRPRAPPALPHKTFLSSSFSCVGSLCFYDGIFSVCTCSESHGVRPPMPPLAGWGRGEGSVGLPEERGGDGRRPVVGG